MDYVFILSAFVLGLVCGAAVMAIWMGDMICDGLCACPPWDEEDDHLLDTPEYQV